MMKRTEKTLLEQMQFSDVEISRRMELLGLTQSCLEVLSTHYDLIEESISDIVDEFYEKQTAIEEIALLIGDSDTLVRLRSAQRDYILDLFSGNYDVEYVNNRLRIGMVHKRIGVEPKLYLSAVSSLKDLIIKVLKSGIKDSEILEKSINILDKLMYFDTTLVFDTYIDSLVSEIEAAKKRTEQYASSLEKKVAERTAQLQRQARLDSLTGIYNMGAMRDELRKALALAKRHGNKLSLIYLDVDDFKKINDLEGHVKGDEVLQHVGKVLQQNVREVDIPCRYGGDEFCVILPDCNSDNAQMVSEKIHSAFHLKYPEIHLSIGISETGSESYDDPKNLIKRADEQMYLAKKSKGTKIKLINS
jgi:diguanylate cyclase